MTYATYMGSLSEEDKQKGDQSLVWWKRRGCGAKTGGEERPSGLAVWESMRRPGRCVWKPLLAEVGERSLKQGSLLSYSVVSDSLQPRGLQSARLLCPWDSPGKNTGVGCQCPPPGDLPNPGIKPRSPTVQADSFTSWATREAQEYWSVLPFPSPGHLPHPVIKLVSLALQMDSLFSFPFHFVFCRWILYQLSHQGSP